MAFTQTNYEFDTDFSTFIVVDRLPSRLREQWQPPARPHLWGVHQVFHILWSLCVTVIFPVVCDGRAVKFIGTGMVMLQYITVMVVVYGYCRGYSHTHANVHSINACKSYSFSLVLTLENAVSTRRNVLNREICSRLLTWLFILVFLILILICIFNLQGLSSWCLPLLLRAVGLHASRVVRRMSGMTLKV